MVQIVDKPSLAALTGQSLGTGLGQGLQMLAENRLNQIRQREAAMRQSQGIQALLGLSPEVAQQAVYAPEKVLQEYAKQQLKAPQQAAYLEALNTLLGGQQQAATEQQPISEQAQAQEAISEKLTQPTALKIPKGISEQQATKLAELGLKQKHEQRQIEMEESKEARAFSKPYREAAKSAANDIRDYNALIKIAPTLRAGSKQQMLDKLGLGDFYRPYTNELATKLMGRLAQNVKGVFGSDSRVTNYLEQVFQRSIPSLWNTPEGIIAISEINKLAAEGRIEENKIRQQYLKETKGKIPYNAEDIIDERMAPILENLEKKTMDIMQHVVTKQPYVGLKQKSLPDPSTTPIGAEGIWNGKKVRNTGLKWEEIKEE